MHRFACVFAFAVLLARQAQAEPAPEPPKKYDLAAIDAYLAGQVQEQGFVGLSVAIMRDGKIVFAKGYGQRSAEKKLPVEADSSFAIGSITKQFTCACVFLLVEEGKLSIDDPVAKFYPHLTRAKDITVRDLMNHTAGYPDYYPLDFVDRRLLKPIALEAMLKEYACGKLDFEPGSRFSYSNTGYIILGGIVEKASGEEFGAFLEKRILKPLKLEHSRYGSARELPLAATGYTAFALGPPEPAEPEADGWIGAAGGLWASASDLLRWDLALVEGKVLKPESYRAMTTQRMLSTGKRSDYACGLSVSVQNGDTVLRHSGGVSGFNSLNVFLPRVKSGLVVLSNTEHVSAEQVRSRLFELLLKDVQERDAPAVPKVAGPEPKEVVLDFMRQMSDVKVDRTKLGEEFSVYLTDERVRSGGARLKALGKPTQVDVDPVHERGGMEVATVMLTFKTAKVRASLYRTPDGKIQQLLFYGEGAPARPMASVTELDPQEVFRTACERLKELEAKYDALKGVSQVEPRLERGEDNRLRSAGFVFEQNALPPGKGPARAKEPAKPFLYISIQVWSGESQQPPAGVRSFKSAGNTYQAWVQVYGSDSELVKAVRKAVDEPLLGPQPPRK